MLKRILVAGAALALAVPAIAQVSRAQAERTQQAQVLQSVGGRYDGPQGEYVSRVGERVAAAAGLPGRCTFLIVDSAVVNAFTTPPGCYIYLTRGLLAVLNTEAELAAVLGHEVGHVAARHAQRQQNTEALSGLAAALVGAVTKSDLAGAVANRAAQLGTLSYSRNQEYEADTLSLRYLPQAGYSPRGLTAVLESLQREDAFTANATGSGPRMTPAWASTHPLTGDRIRRVAQQAAAALDDRTGPDSDRYLAEMAGLVYGDDPDQGFVEGRTFTHPRLRIAFDAPVGFQLANAAEAVRIAGPNGMRGEFSGGRASAGRLEDYAYSVMRAVAGATPLQQSPPVRTTINGVPAVVLPARANTRSGVVELVVAAYAAGGDQAYHFATIAPAGQGGAFDSMYDSFRRLTDREAGSGGPTRLAVATVRAGDTAETMAARMAGDRRLERFLMLNGLRPGEPLQPGRQVKVVAGGRR